MRTPTALRDHRWHREISAASGRQIAAAVTSNGGDRRPHGGRRLPDLAAWVGRAARRTAGPQRNVQRLPPSGFGGQDGSFLGPRATVPAAEAATGAALFERAQDLRARQGSCRSRTCRIPTAGRLSATGPRVGDAIAQGSGERLRGGAESHPCHDVSTSSSYPRADLTRPLTRDDHCGVLVHPVPNPAEHRAPTARGFSLRVAAGPRAGRSSRSDHSLPRGVASFRG